MARTESLQQWERVEIARSSVEATLTADEAPYRAADISPYQRLLTDEELRRFATEFKKWSVRAFALPHVQVAQVLPIVKHHWAAL